MQATQRENIKIIAREGRPVLKKQPHYTPEISETDERIFFDITSQELTSGQIDQIMNPLHVFPRQEEVLAIHWHPEFIPMNLIKQRIQAMYPSARRELIIPTQHNVLMSYGEYSGVEVDCYSRGFQRKVQLLLHFRSSRLQSAHVFKAMLEHTFKYRSSQLYDFLDMVANPRFEDCLQRAAKETGVDLEAIRFSRMQARKLQQLLEMHEGLVPPDMVKNKLIREFIDAQRHMYPDDLVNRSQVFLKSVKQLVKDNFNLSYFYRTSEFIEEARSLGGGVVVPHPEQFWPILLADYDVDGYEVWNPQSREYTEFLVNVISRQNKSRGRHQRRLLVFMGDDTHLSEKLKDPNQAEAGKFYRDIGLQPAWDDLSIRKSLIVANVSLAGIIQEYRTLLDG